MADARKWLSLRQAADLLGVHPTTLRRWADNGDVPVYVTPGGHRRFLESDITAMVEEQLSPASAGAPEQIWVTKALSTTQQRLTTQTDHHAVKLLELFSDEQRQQQRELGNRLLSLIMQHISHDETDDNILVEAKAIAGHYSQSCQALGLSAAQGLEIMIFFRDSMLESALKIPQVADFDADQQLRLVRKLNQVFNLIQLTFIVQYES